MTQEIAKPIQVAPGFFFVVEFSAKGGVAYSRVGKGWEHKEEEKLTAEFTTLKKVDHVGLVKWSRKIVNGAYNTMERFCSPTPIGYWCPIDRADKLQTELDGWRMEAEKLNRHAEQIGSKRRARIAVYKVQAGQESEEQIAIRLANTIRERLENLIADLRAGDLNAYATSWKRAKNLNKLACGVQAESITFALEAAKEARAKLAEKKRESGEHHDPAKLGAELDLTAIESSIVLFTDSVMGNLAVVEDPEAEKAAS